MQENVFTDQKKTHCPYCDAKITLVIDPIEEEQTYTEDCEVCCQPMIVTVLDSGVVELRRESD